MHCTRHVECIVLVLLRYIHLGAGDLAVNSIISESQAGCFAKVQTDFGVRWLSLEDDYKIKKGSTYRAILTDYDITLLWRPCHPFDVGLQPGVAPFDNTCHQTYVALKHKNRTCSSLGKDAQFNLHNGAIEVNYTIADDDRHKARMRLLCNHTEEKGTLRCEQNCGSNDPVLSFSSKYVCLRDKPNSRIPLIVDHNLSAGSLILIIFGFIFMVYLIVGIIRGSLKGRSGCDRLPNTDFWQELPILVKDGCRFTFTCHTPRPMYGRRKRKKEIYQPIIYDNSTPMVDV